MLGLVGDVGDLAKTDPGQGGGAARARPRLDSKLGHELADCLWAVLTLADCYAVDLQAAFETTMSELNHWLDQASTRPTETTLPSSPSSCH